MSLTKENAAALLRWRLVLGAEAGKKLMAAAKVEGLVAEAGGELWVSPGLELRQP